MDDIMRADGPAAVAGALSTDEAERLVELEGMIDRSFAAGFEALEEVRDRRLYRAKYSTFEEYCRGRWGVVASRARQLIGALDVIKDLKALPAAAASDPEKSVTMVTLPENERQARPLVALGPDERREAWSRSVAASPDGKPTSKRVEKEARAVKRQRPAPPSRPGTDSEERRKEQALRGISVLAHMHRDLVLVEWATSEGRLERIDGTTALGNPMKPELMDGDRAAVVAWYRDHWFPFVKDALRLDELRGGKVLGCWCPPGPCHGDVILEHLARPGAEVEAETKPEAVAMPVPEVPPPVPASASAPPSDPAPG